MFTTWTEPAAICRIENCGGRKTWRGFQKSRVIELALSYIKWPLVILFFAPIRVWRYRYISASSLWLSTKCTFNHFHSLIFVIIVNDVEQKITKMLALGKCWQSFLAQLECNWAKKESGSFWVWEVCRKYSRIAEETLQPSFLHLLVLLHLNLWRLGFLRVAHFYFCRRRSGKRAFCLQLSARGIPILALFGRTQFVSVIENVSAS